MQNENSIGKKSSAARWIVCALYLISVVAFAARPDIGTGAIALCGCIFIFLHGSKRYGAKSTIVFVTIAYVISTIMEDLSIHTGFPFGNYHYNADFVSGGLGLPSDITFGDLPWIDQVPLVVGVMYIAMVYFSWSVACVILDHADRHLDNKMNVVALPLVAAFIMVQFDLVQDPVTSTYEGIWIWEEGGGVYGVPLVNFLGWFLTAYLIMQTFTLYLYFRKKPLRETPELKKKSFWFQPILLYFLIGFSYICQYIYQYQNNADAVVTDLRGVTWSVLDMHENSVTVMIFTMLFSVVLAVISLLKDNTIGKHAIAQERSSKDEA